MTRDQEYFELLVRKEYLKFNAAHFIVHRDAREKLHGHNYSVLVRIVGTKLTDGYVIDFRDIKSSMRELCKVLDEKFLCPMKSPHLDIRTVDDKQIEIRTRDNAFFSFPLSDVEQLPIENTSVEEIAKYLTDRLVEKIGKQSLVEAGVTDVAIGIMETPGQEASYNLKLNH